MLREKSLDDMALHVKSHDIGLDSDDEAVIDLKDLGSLRFRSEEDLNADMDSNRNKVRQNAGHSNITRTNFQNLNDPAIIGDCSKLNENDRNERLGLDNQWDSRIETMGPDEGEGHLDNDYASSYDGRSNDLDTPRTYGSNDLDTPRTYGSTEDSVTLSSVFEVCIMTMSCIA